MNTVLIYTMKKLFLVFLILVAVFSSGMLAIAGTNTVTLAWDACCSSEVVGYNIYWGLVTPPGSTNIRSAYTNDCGILVPARTNVYYSYTSRVSVNGRTNNSIRIVGLEQGFRYSFVATSFNSSGEESEYSISTEYTVPTNSLPTVWTNVPSMVQNFHIMQVK